MTTTNTELVELMARAINNSRYDYEADDDWEPTNEDLRDAKAALEVVRPVLEELREAGNALAENLWFGDEESRRTAEEAIARWRSAALNAGVEEG